MNYKNLIVVDPSIRSGKPCLAGTRITVSDILEYMASGMNIEAICADFPEITPDHIRACLGFAADRERLIHASPSA